MQVVAERAGAAEEAPGEARRTDAAAVRVAPLQRREQPAIVILQRYEALGDAITHLPAYYALRHAYPQHRVVGLFARETVFQSSLSLVRPLVFDEIRCGVPLDHGSRELAEHIDSVAAVDTVLDFRANRRALWGFIGSYGRTPRFLANVAGYALRFGIAGFAERRPAENIRRYHRMVEIVAGRQLPYDYRLPQLRAAQERAAALLPAGPRYFGLATSGPGTAKEWPLDRFVAVSTYLVERGLHPVFLLGPLESGLRDTIGTAVPEATFIDMAAAGNDATYLPWLFLAAADRLTGIVATEGGIGHLVATRDIPVLTLAGPTNVRRWKPVTPFWWLVRAQDFGASAMDAIPVEAVQRAIADMLRWADSQAQRENLAVSLSPAAPQPPAASVRAMP